MQSAEIWYATIESFTAVFTKIHSEYHEQEKGDHSKNGSQYSGAWS